MTGDTMTVNVEVTVADIWHGVVMDCSRCPVAMAVVRKVTAVTGEEVRSYVGPDDVYVDSVRPGGPAWRGGVPADVTAFILSFDAGESVMPLAFDLDLTKRACKSGGIP